MIEGPSNLRSSRAERRGNGGRRNCWLLTLGLAWVLSGCASWRPAPVDLADPAWNARRGQAVWHPADRDIELAGEWLGATAADGRGYVQFSKSPMLLAEVRVGPGRWSASFPFMGRRFQGVGAPPGRLVWAQWIRVALGQEPEAGWSFTGDLASGWRLEHARSGEWLEGVSEP